MGNITLSDTFMVMIGIFMLLIIIDYGYWKQFWNYMKVKRKTEQNRDKSKNNKSE